ncbi:hypothetical protein PPACK8108_LOCUS8887 [Phakopsora pachyrhizi]|uniref:Uncharacterized protein n=1 Tax=Phakopsora pachyrhizi TaxID=170000 RepID=A0AAV0AY73_PHAPC|nr:hypothetical protein PPACK8108_LOCUS8887 [Phakopsora pachyrhizi]
MAIKISLRRRIEQSRPKMVLRVQSWKTSNREMDCDNNVEDGVGKVNPIDSGAVDEKFWDEQGSEDGGEEENEAGLSAKQEKEMSKDSELVAKSSSTGGEQNRPQDTQQDQEDQAPN